MFSYFDKEKGIRVNYSYEDGMCAIYDRMQEEMSKRQDNLEDVVDHIETLIDSKAVKINNRNSFDISWDKLEFQDSGRAAYYFHYPYQLSTTYFKPIIDEAKETLGLVIYYDYGFCSIEVTEELDETKVKEFFNQLSQDIILDNLDESKRNAINSYVALIMKTDGEDEDGLPF